MISQNYGCSRRNILKSMGAVGLGSLAGTATPLPDANAEPGGTDQVPTRPFGETGDRVSILALGGDGAWSNQLIMHLSIRRFRLAM